MCRGSVAPGYRTTLSGNSGMRESVMFLERVLGQTESEPESESSAAAPGLLAFRRARACRRHFAPPECHRTIVCALVRLVRRAKDAGRIGSTPRHTADSLPAASGSGMWP